MVADTNITAFPGGERNRPSDASYSRGMPSKKKSSPTGWDSLPGDPFAQPYGLPFFPGEKVSVSYGWLVPSFWWEHVFDSVRIIFGFKAASGMVETTEGDAYRLPGPLIRPYHFCIIPAGIQTTFEWAKRAEVVVLYLDPQVFQIPRLLAAEVTVWDFRRVARTDPSLSQLAQIFLGLCRQTSQPEPIFVEGLGMALASRTLQACFRGDRASSRIARSGLSLEMVKTIDAHIAAHLAEVISARDLARQVSLSPDHFCRRFRISTQMTPMQYVQRRKMEKVRELLETGECNVSEAAEKMGFCDLSHLSRCFRKCFGFPPKTVRKTSLPTDSYQ